MIVDPRVSCIEPAEMHRAEEDVPVPLVEVAVTYDPKALTVLTPRELTRLQLSE